MKILILSLALVSQVSLANFSVGNFGHGSKSLGGSQGGSLRPEGSLFKMTGNGQGTMSGSVGTMKVAGNSVGTLGGRRSGSMIAYRFADGTGGGGILVKGSNGVDNSRVGTL